MGEVFRRGRIWWIRYCRNGKRYPESSGREKKQQAIALLKLLESDGASGVPVTPAIDFVEEMISGGVANVAVFASAEGREMEIETRFAADLDNTDLSDWVDNTTPENVGQLGYWVGYRIARSYYHHAPDKRAAIREMIEMTDPHAFLARSGWYPGIVLN
jgi:hypothetical protein